MVYSSVCVSKESVATVFGVYKVVGTEETNSKVSKESETVSKELGTLFTVF